MPKDEVCQSIPGDTKVRCRIIRGFLGFVVTFQCSSLEIINDRPFLSITASYMLDFMAKIEPEAVDIGPFERKADHGRLALINPKTNSINFRIWDWFNDY
jgi:hypothetical protein